MITALLGPLLALGAASGVAIPPCPAVDRAVLVFVPSYVRVGASVQVELFRRPGSPVVDAVHVVAVSRPSGARQEFDIPVPEDATLGKLDVAVPAGQAAMSVTTRYEQQPRSGGRCSVEQHSEVPTVPVGAHVGRPGVRRLPPVLIVRAGGHRERWRLKPHCDVFGCATDLTVDGAPVGTFFVTDAGTYLLQRSRRLRSCVARDQRIELRVTDVGPPAQVSGTRDTTYDVAHPRRRCDVPTDRHVLLTGRQP